MTRTNLTLLVAAILTATTYSATAETKAADSANHRGVIDNSNSPHVKLRSVPMQDTELTGGFWKQRFELCAAKMIPTMKEAMSGPASARLGRLEWAAGLRKDNPGGVPWADGDCYKWIETMAHVYNLTRAPALDAEMDKWIGVTAKAQEPDGYISTNIRGKENRFYRVNQHQLYNMGHLLTAACVHFRVTGKENFLAIATKTADFLCQQWKDEPAKMVNYPWNPSVYMGLAEIYRTTGKPDYLALLQTMIDNRGSRPNPKREHQHGGTDQTQDRVPLREETIAVGHAVCGNYLYSGAADLYAETGEQAILDALERIWNDLCGRKADIVCAVAMGKGNPSPRGDRLHEHFPVEPYIQPNEYNETCANIGTGMFSYRMLLLTGDAKYADWTERMLYNTLPAGVDLAGEKWFYCNPISWDGTLGQMKPATGGDTEALATGHHTAVRWRTNNCYCCPPSVARTSAKVHNWFYNVSDDAALWVNFYGGSKLATKLTDGSAIALTQTTDYPWDGRIEITIDEAGPRPFPIRLRIPGWAEDATVTVNGKTQDAAVPGSYLAIERKWSNGDRIVLDFPMPVRMIAANPKVKKLQDRLAIMRGPVVYCMELPREEGGDEVYLNGVLLPENAEFTPEYRADFLGGLTVLKGKALTFEGAEAFVRSNPGAGAVPATEEGPLYQPIKPRDFAIPPEGTIELMLIPYYAWANRGIAYMDVWIPLATVVQLAAQQSVVHEVRERIAAEETRRPGRWTDNSGWTLVNDSCTDIRYSPDMKCFFSKDLIGGDEHYTETKGSYFELTFTGTEIKWIGTKGPWRGYADVFIDGEKVVEVNSYAPDPDMQVVLFHDKELPAGEHTIRIVCQARKGDTNGRQPYISLDALKFRGAEAWEE